MHIWQLVLLSGGRYGRACRSAAALLAGICCGIFSVLVDLDHLISVVSHGCTWDVANHAFGCRLWHIYLLPAGVLIGRGSGALFLGLCIILVGFAAWAAAGIGDTAWNVTDAEE